MNTQKKGIDKKRRGQDQTNKVTQAPTQSSKSSAFQSKEKHRLEMIATPHPYIFVFYDNSNIWIEGKKFMKNLKGFRGSVGNLDQDTTWRFNVNEFLKLAQEKYNGTIKKGALYGSRPPPIDEVWDNFNKQIECKIFDRSRFTGREKKVDSNLQNDAHKTAEAIGYFVSDIDTNERFQDAKKRRTQTFLNHCKTLDIDLNNEAFDFNKFIRSLKNSIILIASGDSDFECLINTIKEKNVRVAIWAWKHTLSKMYLNRQDIDIVFFDEYHDRIGFNEKVWNIKKKNIPLDRSFIFINAETYKNDVYDFLENHNILHYGGWTNDNDLYIICAGNMENDQLVKLISEAKSSIKMHSNDIISYAEYLQRRNSVGSEQNQIELKNMFDCLRDSEDNNDSEDSEDSEGFKMIDNRRVIKSASKPKIRCNLRKYCQNIANGNCKFGHSKEEYEQARQYKNKISKIKMCTKTNCEHNIKPEKCRFAHSMHEVLCPTCDQKGQHLMENCPQRNTPFGSN